MFNPWVLLVLFSAFVFNGLYWNAHGSNAEHARMVAKLESERAQALQNVRDTESKWQEKVNEITKKQAEKLAEVQHHLDVAIVSLRDRPKRPATLPDTPRAECEGASGRELSREDAEFLTREAARADALREGLEACYATLDGSAE
jgi:hypothetical protein